MTTTKRTKLQWLESLRGADLTHAEFRILVIIATYTNANRTNAFPGFTTIVRESRVDEKTARSALRSLQAKGYLVLLEEGGNRHWKGKANVYGVTTPVAQTKGGNDSRKGGNDSRARGGIIGGPSGYENRALDPSAPSGAGPLPRTPALPTNWENNYGAVEEWLEQHLGIDSMESNTALNMWEDNYNPRAIWNKILADRSQFQGVDK